MSKTINIKSAMFITACLSVLIWLAVTFTKDEPFTTWYALKALPTTAGYMTILLGIFVSYGWRLRIFKSWLVLIPDLNGTWVGELRSEWLDNETKQKVSTRKAFLVIKQSLFETNCCLLTAESKSYSQAASIQTAPDGDLKILKFIYSNSPRISVQHKSHAHDGACSLDVIDNPERMLLGKYWTDRNTKGEIDFKFESLKHRQVF